MKRLHWTIIATLALALPAGAWAEETYKWVDEEGSVHYGGQPPLGSQPEKVRVYRGGGDAGAPAPSYGEADGGGQTESQAAAGADQAAAEVDPERAAAICDQATRTLEILESRGRVRERDESGNIVVLSDEQKRAREDKARELIDEYCP